jgi:hypothetical protein
VSEAAPGHFGDLPAEGGYERRDDQRRLVADAAGAVLVRGEAAEHGQVDAVAGARHGGRQRRHLAIVHVVEKNGHQEGRYLVIRDLSAREAFHYEGDFFFAERPAVSFFLYDVVDAHACFLRFH